MQPQTWSLTEKEVLRLRDNLLRDKDHLHNDEDPGLNDKDLGFSDKDLGLICHFPWTRLTGNCGQTSSIGVWQSSIVNCQLDVESASVGRVGAC